MGEGQPGIKTTSPIPRIFIELSSPYGEVFCAPAPQNLVLFKTE